MKKIGLILVGVIAAIILLKTIGPMIALLFSLVILFFIIKQFLKTDSLVWKIALVILGVIFLSATIHHLPAVIGLGAAYVLYLVYKQWKGNKRQP